MARPQMAMAVFSILPKSYEHLASKKAMREALLVQFKSSPLSRIAPRRDPISHGSRAFVVHRRRPLYLVR